jgi:protein gp37
MGADSKIEWTDHTFNPWLGCTKVSPACAHCYAEAWAKRTGIVKWGDGAERRKTTQSYWRQPLKWNAEAAQSRERKRVFCASLADVFEDRPELEPWRKELFSLIYRTPRLDWLLLTKRPENITRLLRKCVNKTSLGWGFPVNAWLGTTVESDEQRTRADDLIEAGGEFASVLFLSCEPLLGPLDLTANQRYQVENGGYRPLIDDIQWVITGGESGGHARPSHPDWFRNLRDQCLKASVPFHFKQWGEWSPVVRDTHTYSEGAGTHGAYFENGKWVTFRRGEAHGEVFRLGKKQAGRLLDGKEWNEYPNAKGVAAV